MIPRLLANWRWGNYIGRLREEPGIVVTDHGRQNGRYVVRGLRDPLARDPAAMLGEFKLEPEDVAQRWEPYIALLPQFVLGRATRILAPPPSVRTMLVVVVVTREGSPPRPSTSPSCRR